MTQLYHEVAHIAEPMEKVLIISHRKPDADTLGAGIALRIWLQKIGKQVTSACFDVPAPAFDFFPHIDEFVQEFDLSDFDLIFVVDAGASYMTNFHLKYENLFTSGIPMINIDHHASNENFGTLNIVDRTASSVTIIIYKMFKELGIAIDKDIATCLLAGIYGDTGSFMHSNTTFEAMKISADLVDMGAEIHQICNGLFKERQVSTLRLWGMAMEKARMTNDGVVMSVMKKEDFEKVQSCPEQLSGVVDYLNMVPATRFAVLLTEDRHGNVKGSLRTRQKDVDVSKVAANFGGGGHPKASGFSIPGKLEQQMHYTVVTDNSKKILDF